MICNCIGKVGPRNNIAEKTKINFRGIRLRCRKLNSQRICCIGKIAVPVAVSQKHIPEIAIAINRSAIEIQLSLIIDCLRDIAIRKLRADEHQEDAKYDGKIINAHYSLQIINTLVLIS